MAKDKKHLEQRKKLREDKTDAQNKVIASRIRDLMQEADITSKELAAACYRDEADISRWLNKEGINKIPVWELSLISTYLDEKTEQGCCIEYLIGQSDARHYEYDSLVKKTGLSDASIIELIKRSDENETECIDSLLVNAEEFITNLHIYSLLVEISKVRKGTIKEKQIEDAVALGRIAYNAALTDSDVNTQSLFDLFKKWFYQSMPENVDISGLSDDNLAKIFEFTSDSYRIEVQQQKCIKELTLYLESMK